jgi:branched-chain amino acid transport system ATP-binding protein
MLVIGRGLMADPKLMLLDEMSLGLAPIVVNELFKALKEIREAGITILFVEQNVRRTLQEADRAYILETGRVTLSGAAAQLREEEQVKKAYFGI